MSQKARRIGMGMKPRAQEEASLPTTEGHEELPSDPIQEHVPAAVGGGDLESVSAEQPEEVSEPEAEKEPELHATEVPAAPEEAFDALAAVMKASEGASGAEPQVDRIDIYRQTPDHEYILQQSAEIDRLAEKMLPEMMEGLEKIVPICEDSAEFELKCGLQAFAMGILPTGEYRHTVRIAESYVEGAKQQAEADGVSLEDWLTIQLHAYLEQYWWANGQK